MSERPSLGVDFLRTGFYSKIAIFDGYDLEIPRNPMVWWKRYMIWYFDLLKANHGI